VTDAQNPAGRLHDFLAHFHALSDTGSASIATTWARTLRVDTEEIGPHLVKMAGLLADVNEAIERDGRSSLMRQQARWGGKWYELVLFPSHSQGQPASAILSYAAVDSLAVVSDVLDSSPRAALQVQPIDRTVEPTLREAISEALDAVRADESLPDDLRRAFSQRLHEMSRALDDLDFGGTEAVQIVAERIAARMPASEEGKSPSTRALFKVLGIVFRYGPPVVSAVAALSGSPVAAAIGWEPLLALPPGQGDGSNAVTSDGDELQED
jgi:hypothetical protein